MQPLQTLERWLRYRHRQTRQPSGLFRANDFRSLFPQMKPGAYRALLHRARQRGLLVPVCSGVDQYAGAPDTSGHTLFHTAVLLRAGHFNYISLETALSDDGIISQIPISWISLVSTGRSATIDCGQYGSIEFVHTQRAMSNIASQLNYDAPRHLFRANTRLAIDDMRRFNRHVTTDLIHIPEGQP